MGLFKALRLCQPLAEGVPFATSLRPFEIVACSQQLYGWFAIDNKAIT